VDGTRLPCGGFGDEAVEEGAGCGADVVTALGVPLDAEDKVAVWIVGVLTAFDGFDDGVLGAAGGDAEAVAGDADGLVMAGVDGEAEEVFLLRGFFRGEKCAEKGFRGDCSRVGDRDFAACGVIDEKRAKVLYERASAPGIEDLGSKADSEERLVEVVGVLEEEFVDVFAGGVGWGALGDGVVAVLVRVDVGGTAGKENGVAGVDEIDGLDWRGMERDFDWLAAAALDAGGVLGPGTVIVAGVGAGGLGDSDAGLHDLVNDTAGDRGSARISADGTIVRS